MKTFKEIYNLREATNVLEIKDSLDWFPTKKKSYTIEGMIPDKVTKITNKLEGTDYIVDPEKDEVILKGTVGELWRAPLAKVIKTYTTNGGNSISASDFDFTDQWVTLETKGSDSYTNFAAKLPNEIIEVQTSWGDILHANLPGREHGDGDYVVCNMKDGRPDFSDIWVVNGAVFPTTYES